MTKYILHGGETKIENESNRNFFHEVLKDLPKNPNLLLCLFARDEEKWPEEKIKLIKRFSKANPKRKIKFVVASKNPRDLKSQIEKSDAIYLHGGRTKRLKLYFSKISNLNDLFNNKTVAGSSAGAHFLSKYYYSPSNIGLETGSGFLDIKVISHFRSKKFPVEYDKATKELELFKEKLPIYKIKETEFCIINK